MNSATRYQHPITSALVTLVEGICYHPDELDVTERLKGKRLAIDLAAHADDTPVLIGRLGRQAKAIKFLACEMGKRAGLEVDLQIRDSYRGIREDPHEIVRNGTFTNEDFEDALVPVLKLVFEEIPPMEFREEDGRTSLLLDLPREHSTTGQAIANAFYPFAIRKGRKIRILNRNYQPDEPET